MIYLASPYSHPDPAVKQARNDMIMETTALLMNDGFIIISPIAASHPIAIKHNLPGDYAYWQKWNHALMDACSELWVCTMDGWKESTGVTGEMEYARSKGMPINYYDPIEKQLSINKEFNPDDIIWIH